MNPPRLYLNFITELDWLIALEFGRVDDAQPPENWRGVSERFGFLCEKPGGREVGFKILEFSRFNPETSDLEELWDGPRFDAPVLGLTGSTAGEITLAARKLFGNTSTINRIYFNSASGSKPAEALPLWIACLQTGDFMAHFGLGCTLYDLGRYTEAYRHLRFYAEIAPQGSWNHRWYGVAAREVGETEEARKAFQRAIELEAEGDLETDARELLAAL